MKIVQQPPMDPKISINYEAILAILHKISEIAKRTLPEQSDTSGSLILKVNEDGEIDANAYELLHNVLKQAYGSVKVKPVEGGMEFIW